MTVRFNRKQNKWYCHFQVDGIEKHLLCKGAKNQAEARKLEIIYKNELVLQVTDIIPVIDNNLKLKQLYNLYEDYARINKKSYERSDKYIVKSLKNYFKEDTFAKTIKPNAIELFKAKLKKQKLSDATVNKYLNVLSKMFSLGIDNNLILKNPCKTIKKFPQKNTKIRFLTKSEEKRLFVAIEQHAPHIKPIVIVALQTGMRISEIFNLKWENVMLENNYIEVLNSKNNDSRKIPISPKLKELLLSLPKNSDYVLPSEVTNDRYNNISKSLKTVLKMAKIENFTFHCFRHTVATRMVEKGIDLVVVKEILGHRKLSSTMIYAHAVPERKLKAVEVLSNYC